jgi:hypothetical protein
LDSPNTDLRRRWARDWDQASRTLRVYRGGAALDVTLPGKSGDAPWSNVLLKPADAVREFAALGRTLQFASFAVHVSDETSYSATLTLRFTRPQATRVSAQR